MQRDWDIAAECCTDRDIVTASLSDPERFAEIFLRHFQAIHAYLVRRVGRSLADDLASQVFVVAFESRGRFRDETLDMRPWLYGISTNLVRNNRRSERRALAALLRLRGEAEPLAVDFPPAELGVDGRRLVRALARLDPDQRDVLLLHAWEGLSHSEIALALGIPAGTVASRFARGRQRLRAALVDIRETSGGEVLQIPSREEPT